MKFEEDDEKMWWIHRDALEDLSFGHFPLLSHQLRGLTLTLECNPVCLFFRVCVLINKTQVLFIVNRLECSGSYFIQLAVFLSCFHFHPWNRNTLYIHRHIHSIAPKKKKNTHCKQQRRRRRTVMCGVNGGPGDQKQLHSYAHCTDIYGTNIIGNIRLWWCIIMVPDKIVCADCDMLTILLPSHYLCYAMRALTRLCAMTLKSRCFFSYTVEMNSQVRLL